MEVSATITLNLDDLASEITDQSDHASTTDFIMQIDERVGDYGFTVRLIERLQAVLAAEDEAANGTLL